MSLILNSTPAERTSGCFFAETFSNRANVEDYGAIITGTPSFDYKMTMDGDDGIYYDNLVQEFEQATSLSFVIKFIPDFETDVDDSAYFLLAQGTTYSLLKRDNANNNSLRCTLGGSFAFNIAEGTYSPYWNVNQVNTLVLTADSGDIDVWLNGTQIATAVANAWSPGTITNFIIGMGNTSGAFGFSSQIREFKIFNRKLTDKEATDYCSNTVYSYEDNIGLNLPMDFENHDPVNSRTLDISGNGSHASFGAGTAEPTKNAMLPGYDFDGTDDYMSVTSAASNTFGDGSTDSPFSVSFWMRANTASSFRAIHKRGTNAEYQLTMASNTRIYWTLHDDDAGAVIGRSGTLDMDIYDGQWTHLCGTYDGTALSEGCRFYVNGIRRDSFNNQSGTYVAMEDTGEPVTIGEYVAFADGTIAFIKIFSEELTPMQVNDLYIKEQFRINRI